MSARMPAISQSAAAVQRPRRASARPIAWTVSGASTRPSRVTVSSCSTSVPARASSGGIVNRLPDGADRLREVGDRMMPRDIARFEMHLGGAVIVAGNEAVKDFGEEQPFPRPEPAHDAEVDRDQQARVIDKQVSGMHV